MLYPKSFDYSEGPEPWPAHNGQPKPKRKPNSCHDDPESQYDPYVNEQEEDDQHHRQQYAHHDQGPKYIITGSSDDGYFKYILVLLIGLVFIGGINVWKTTHNGVFTQQAMTISVQSNQEQIAYAQRWNDKMVRAEEENRRIEEQERARTEIHHVTTPIGTISHTGGASPDLLASAMALTVSKLDADNEADKKRQEDRRNAMESAQRLTQVAINNMQESGNEAIRAIKGIGSDTSAMASRIVDSVNDMTENVIKANTKFAKTAIESTKFGTTSC